MAMTKKTSLWLTTFLLTLLLAVTLTTTSVNAAKPSARASHILVATEAECDALLEELQQADNLVEKFAELARAKSTCPSGRKGGDLGKFGRGQMVKEFDAVVFEQPVGVVHKVQTQFGWHLVLTKERSGMPEPVIESDVDSEL